MVICTGNEFWLEPMAGLGNRLQAMASAWYFSKKYQKTLCILWSNDSGLGADFQDLFETIPGVRIVTVTAAGYRKKPFLRLKSQLLRRKLAAKCSYVSHIDEWGKKTPEELYPMIDAQIRNASDVFISSWKNFVPIYQNPEVTMDFLHPSKAVYQRGKALFSQLTDKTIGVHIRRTDHEYAIEKSPLSAFVVQMQKELAEDAAAHFYVATDDQVVEQEIREQFGDRVTFYDMKSWGRAHKAGMLDACVELWALSKCRKILGSKGSTFGMMAAKIGNIPIEMVEMN